MHPFDEWFSRTHPAPQPQGTRETAIIAWNAALHAARNSASNAKDRLVEQQQYEYAVIIRDFAEKDLRDLSRPYERGQSGT